MDGDVTGNDNISGVSVDRESRETFAGFSASAAGESTTDVNSGLVERPEEHYESDGESSDVDVDDAMSSGFDADDQDNSSLTMPPPDAETSSEKTSLATAPTATELTIPPLLQLLISFVLFYADVGTDVAAVVEAEADVTAPRNLVYLMVCMRPTAHESGSSISFFFFSTNAQKRCTHAHVHNSETSGCSLFLLLHPRTLVCVANHFLLSSFFSFLLEDESDDVFGVFFAILIPLSPFCVTLVFCFKGGAACSLPACACLA